MSTTSAAAQDASRPAAVTCHRDLGIFSAEASAVTPTSLARGSGARAPPALGNSARVSPFDIAAAAVTSREVEDQGRDSARDGVADTTRARVGCYGRAKFFLPSVTICPYKYIGAEGERTTSAPAEKTRVASDSS